MAGYSSLLLKPDTGYLISGKMSGGYQIFGLVQTSQTDTKYMECPTDTGYSVYVSGRPDILPYIFIRPDIQPDGEFDTRYISNGKMCINAFLIFIF